MSITKKNINFILNGHPVKVRTTPNQSLLNILRNHFELTGTKESCSKGECGACTVIVDGYAVNSCLIPVLEVKDCKIETIENLLDPKGKLHPLQEAFIKYGAIQCGFCTPGMLMSIKALLDKNKSPNEKEIRTAIEGNLCRCTGYKQIIDAVKAITENK